LNEIIKATIETEWQLIGGYLAGTTPEELEREVLGAIPERLHNAELPALVVAVMTGELAHLYQGSCPDTLQPNERDSGCLACRVIMEYERINQLSRGTN
jgi:hypothetical protein